MAAEPDGQSTNFAVDPFVMPGPNNVRHAAAAIAKVVRGYLSNSSGNIFDRQNTATPIFSVTVRTPYLDARPIMTYPRPQKHLLIIQDEAGQHEYFLDAPIYSIGRHPKCDIQIFSQFISRRHATLMQFPNEEGGFCYHIVDGNLKGNRSANGLLINGQRLQQHVLQHADSVDFGSHVQATYYVVCEDLPSSDITDDVVTTTVNIPFPLTNEDLTVGRPG